MTIITSLIAHTRAKKRMLYLSNKQQRLFNLTPGEQISLEIGPGEMLVKVAEAPDILADSLYVSSGVIDAIPFYLGEPLSLVYSSPSRISLGPTVGIGVSKSGWRKIQTKKALRKRALLAHKKGILLYFFQLPSVDWETNTVNAYCLNPAKKKWVQQNIAIPEVIYDRGSDPALNALHGSTQGATGPLWLNATRTLSKWETHKALRLGQGAANLPETALLSEASMQYFLEKFPFCYVKSSIGRNGRQVGRVLKDSGNYIWKTGGSETSTKIFPDQEQLYIYLVGLLGKDSIIQQGINLAQFGESPFDMRVLVQKNGVSQWGVTAVNIRIGAPKAIVTNFSAGARDMFFSPGAPLPKGLCWDEITELSLKIATEMEAYFGRLGEMGLDLGMDQRGKLWLIEVNSRPSSTAYTKAPDHALDLIFGLPLDYAAFLVRSTRGTGLDK